MNLYQSEAIPQKERYIHNGEKLFLKQVENGFEGKKVTVDKVHTDIPMIIQKHTNPLNKNLHDMKAKYLDSSGNFMHMGNVIQLDDGKTYMAVTEPSSNGIYSEYKILPLTDDMKFNLNTPVEMKCVVANKGFYDETSFVNDTTVFEDKDTRATIVQYNTNTSQLTLFDDVYVNDQHYKIVKIDNYTLKEYDDEFGVLQMVIIDTPFGDIVKNKIENIKGIVMTARVKDKILNSVSRELRCYHNVVKRGDYVDFKYKFYDYGENVTETYLIVNKPTMSSEGYSTSLLYLCESKMNLLNDKGAVVNVPVYFENNRMRIDKTSEDEYSKFANSSFMVVVQNNDTTLLRCKNLKRLIIDGKPYEITGIDDTAKGLISIGLNSSQLTPDDNLEIGIANYYSQMEEVNGGSIEPETPVSDIKIVEANGEVSLYKGYENEYYLNLVESGITWSVDVDWIDMRQDGSRCLISFNELKYIGETITLTALVGEDEYTLTIKCVDM